MGKMKVPEPSASPSSPACLVKGVASTAGLKANLIRSRTQGLEECCSPPFHPSLGSCLVTAIGRASGGSDSVSLFPTVSLSFSNGGSEGRLATALPSDLQGPLLLASPGTHE